MVDPKKIFENFEANAFDLVRMLTKEESVSIDIRKNDVRITVLHELGEDLSEQASYTWRSK